MAALAAAKNEITNEAVPMEVDKSNIENENTSDNHPVIVWNYSAPEPDYLKGYLDIKNAAIKRLRPESDAYYEENGKMTKSIKSLLAESKMYRDRIKRFLDHKSYLFTTPKADLPKHTSFIRDYNSNNIPKYFNGTSLDGVECLTVISSFEASLLPTGDFKRKELKVGTHVWAMDTNFNERFLQGTITALKNPGIYKVRVDDGKSHPYKFYDSKELAYQELSSVVIKVGTRIIARYADGMYAGVVAEEPKAALNKGRYLIFFDDGYAQYIRHEDIRVVCSQSKDVSDDISLEVKHFVREYLAVHPERAMLRLQKDQRIKAEFDCSWLDTKVLEVDCSMVQLLFLKSNRKEWLYRGSTRLKPLHDELTNAETNRLSGKHRRHNIVPRKPHLPYVEYTRDVVNLDCAESDGERSSPASSQASTLVNGHKSKNTARKSGTLPPRKPEKVITTGKMERDCKSHSGTKDYDRINAYERNKFRNHGTCSYLCREFGDVSSLLGKCSPLAIPIHLGWERQIRKYWSKEPKVVVFYRAPCGRHLRNLQEIQRHLWNVSSNLTIDFFTLNPYLNPFRFFIPKDIKYEIEDVAEGQENVKISCVNTWSSAAPPHVDYAAKRFPGKGVDLNEDKEFLIGCSCTNNCQNSNSCECQQITNYAHTGQKEGNSGYKFRRLKESLITGVYECNDRCKCGPQCANRVIQNGVKVRLQMFKTQRKGWGIRCLDDVEAGMFICIYAGQLLTEEAADEGGRKLGDEYLAELDHIEVNERTKEGYEHDVDDSLVDGDENNSEKKKSSSSEISTPDSSDSEQISDDSEFELGIRTTARSTYDTRSEGKTYYKNKSKNSLKENYSKDLSDITGKMDLSSKSLADTSFSLSFPLSLFEEKKYRSIRSFYAENNSLFLMDAKTKGNIGRYLNHSCDPNLFVQSVFVNTHDLRFHEVAFFAQKFIMAGTELTWDYNYEVGSVADKIMYCYCDSRHCRGRLL